MFEKITTSMSARMKHLEMIDEKDRTDGTQKANRLRQIPPETGKFLALIAANCPKGDFVEIGTSAGYSTMWISLAAMEKDVAIKTHELLPEKIKLAKETFKLAEIESYVQLIEGDAVENLKKLDGEIAFCFLDTEKELYEQCYDIIIPKLVKGGVLVADNAINHYETLKPMIDKSLQDERVDSLVVPIGKGELVCRKK